MKAVVMAWAGEYLSFLQWETRLMILRFGLMSGW